MTGSVSTGRAVGVVYLDVSEALSVVSHVIPVAQLVKYGLVRWTVKWLEN